MALISCPECGGQVSDRAPTCPHCGAPIAGVVNAASVAPAAAAAAASDQEPASAPTTAAAEQEPVEPYRFQFRLAGRRVPVAMLLFWGGMVVGMAMSYITPLPEGAEPELWRRIPYGMIFLGVLWFAITEFYEAMRNRRLRQG
ncbi:MAG: zinc ribbon domain-containing protein [Chromatiaceae bacterium]|nr:MAG: zinc ribbon domain-containing protein [Chromatiaceae bacterium]